MTKLGRKVGTFNREPVIADDLERKIAETLRRRRVELQLTQVELAEAVGISTGSVQRIERGYGSLSLPMARDVLQGVGFSLAVVPIETTETQSRIVALDREHWSEPAGPIQKLAKTREELIELFRAAEDFDRNPCEGNRLAFARELADVALTLQAVAGRLGVESLEAIMLATIDRIEARIGGDDPKPMNPTPSLCPECYLGIPDSDCERCGGHGYVVGEPADDGPCLNPDCPIGCPDSHALERFM